MVEPKLFGKYILIERVSVGGMAEVFKSLMVGTGGFQKILAIKRVLPNIAEDAEFVKMFVDEANIAGLLHHANVAQIYDLGIIDGSYFIAMEYVEGKDLRAIFDRLKKLQRSIPVDLACYVTAMSLAGMDYAHRKTDAAMKPLNIVHRDVSPPNLLISYEGDVKLIDFGIAKAAKKASKTQAGILKGKFGYMSPEQVRGLPVDARSDIFSIGIILHEMLARKRLFVGESDFSTLEKVRGMEIKPPSAFNSEVPPEVDQIVLKALERDLKKRYQSSADMQHDLQRYLYSQPEVFTQQSMAEWMQDTFRDDLAAAKERMEEMENLDFERYGIDLKQLELAQVQSLRNDNVQARESSETRITPYYTDHTGEPTGFYATGMGKRSLTPLASVLGVLLLATLLVGWLLLNGVEARVMRVHNPPPYASVTFNANLPGAFVHFRGKPLCKTPCRITDFWTGKHEVTFRKDGYLPDTVTFSADAGTETPVAGSLFKPGDVPAVLLVRTDPPGASVFVDNRPTGQKTPAVLNRMKAGRPSMIKVSAPGFHDNMESVTLEKEEFKTVSINLIPTHPRVRVVSDPPGAAIVLDRKRSGLTTPAELKDLEKGRLYNLKLYKSGYRATRVRFKATGLREDRIDVELETREGFPDIQHISGDPNAAFGWLNIITDPVSSVYIDGRKIDADAPVMGVRLPVGEHVVRLIAPDWNLEHEQTVTIKGGATTRLVKSFDL